MHFNIQLAVVLLKIVYSIQSDFYSYSEEEVKNPWSAENSSNLTKFNSQYVPKFQLENLKIRKLQRFDGVVNNELNKSDLSFDNKVNVNRASYTKFSKIGESFSNNRDKSESGVHSVNSTNRDSQLQRYLSKPKKGLIYYINSHENPSNQMTSTPKPLYNMYMTREQHEQEILMLKRKYESECNLKLKNKGSSTTTKKPQKKKKNSKPSNLEPNIVQTIGNVLETIYETVADTVTTKVVKKRKNKTPKISNIQGQKKILIPQSKMIDASGENIELSNESINLLSEFPSQLEIPQSLHSSNESTYAEFQEDNDAKFQMPAKEKTRFIPLVLPEVSKRKKISKRSTAATKASKLQYIPPKAEAVNKSVNGNAQKNHLTTHNHVTSEDNGINTAGPRIVSSTLEPKTTPMPCKKSELDNSYDDIYFDFSDIFYDDYDYSEEEKDDLSDNLSLSSESEEKYRKDILRKKNKIKKMRQRKVLRKYDFFGFFDYVKNVIKPIRRVIRRLIADTTDLGLTTGIIDNRKPKNPQNSIYNGGNIENNENSIESPFGSWFGNWFSFKEKDNVETELPTTEEPGWFDSWFNTEKRATTPTSDDYEADEDWFFNWFNSKPKIKDATTTTTTSVPILTISDPMKNPQKWIGILAQHIVNSTAKPPENLTASSNVPQKITYENYQIWRLKPNGEEQLHIIKDYKNSKEGSILQWLQGPSSRGPTDVLIPPKHVHDFRSTLNFEGISYEVMLFDLGKAMLYENTKEKIYTSPKLRYPMNWNTYYSYDEILRFVESIRIKNPTLVDIIHIGRSYEGRPLVVVKIGIKQKNSSHKRSKLKKKSQKTEVFVEAGSHGRQWIGPASATWIINEVVKIMKHNGTSPDEESFKKATWYIIPVTNPDGYEYSREYDRMWRKSRSKYNSNSDSLLHTAMTWFKPVKSEKICYGVDLDRNWDYQWSLEGSSKSPCNEFFAGTSAFSEPETRAVSRFLMDHRKQIKLFISLHSYGQIVSYPNKLNSSYGSQKLDDLTDVAMVGIDGLRKSGSSTRYKIDSNGDMIAQKSGSADYFAMFEVGIPFSYTIHLGDNGVHGFLLPASQIEPTAKDAFEIIKAMVEYI